MNDPATQPADIDPAGDEHDLVTPSTRDQVFFRVAVLFWITTYGLSRSIAQTMQPALEIWEYINTCLLLSTLLAANFAAILPMVRKEIRSNGLNFIGWILSVFCAFLMDIGFLWGLIELIL